MQDSSDAAQALDPAALGHQLFEASPDCVKLLDAEGHIVAMNGNGLRVMEFGSMDAVRGQRWSSLWPDACRPAVDAAMAAARERGLGRLRAACPTAGGTVKWWDVTISPVGQAGLLATSRDITDQVRAEAEREDLVRQLRAASERFEKIVSQAATGVVQMDGEGRILLVNQKYCDMVQRPEVELLGMSVLDVTAPHSVPVTLEAVRRLREGETGVIVEKEYLRRDGSVMPATSSVNALRGPDGELQGLVAIVVDTTESRRAAEELRASEERYRTLFESMDQGFCILEMIFDEQDRPADYRFLEMNPMFEAHTGLHDAAGRTARELIPNLDGYWFKTYGRVAQTGESVRFENEAPAMGRWFDVYATRLGGPGSNKVALLFSDITARKQSEATLLNLAKDLAESDRRKTEFLATLAHELRNPLAPIRSGLAVMRLKDDDAASVARVREMMERQVGHMVHLIDDLLDIARISGGKLELRKERADLRSVLSSAVETSLPLIDGGRHALSVDMPEGEVPAEVDVNRIAQVVANLLNNAAKYTPAGGRIGLSLRVEGQEAVIAVADNGVGIPQDELASVFEMFSQVGHHLERSQGGLGIGLSLVRRLVDMHGGAVSASSDGPQAGSVFTVRLPLAGSPMGAAPEPASDGAARAAGEGTRILVVDDNVDAAMTLSMILEACGYETRVAHGGLEALEAAKQFRPRVAFLDIGMPGMDGYDTARAMRRLSGQENMTLIALTGWGAESDRRKSNEAGFDQHLIKPVQLDVVQELLAKLAA